MTTKSFVGAFSYLLLFTITAGSAFAVSPPVRTYVSSSGSDSNTCSVSSPCLTFSGAYSKTAIGGEIDALDPADYGQLTITHSITINGDGTNAAVSVPTSGNGIIVDAGATDNVVLEHLSFNGGPNLANQALNGILDDDAGLLRIDDCTFTGAFFYGVQADIAFTGTVDISNSIFSCIDGGIYAQANSGSANVTITNCSFSNVVTGIAAVTGALVCVNNSQISNTSGNALDASNGGILSAESCILSGDGAAVYSVSPSRIRLSNCSLFNNQFGIYPAGGVVSSSHDNKLAGNGSAGVPNASINIE